MRVARGARRDFDLFMFGQVSTSFGSALTAVVIPLIAVEKFRAGAWQMGLLHAATAVPVIFFGFLVGVWSDRRRRKRLSLIWTDIASAAIIGLLFLGLVTEVASFYWLILVMLFFSISSLAVEALYFSHLQSVIGDRTVMSARARLIAGERLGSATGQGLSGVLVWLGGYAFPLIIDAVSYIANAACLGSIRSPDEAEVSKRHPKLSRELADGFRAIAQVPVLRAFSTFGLLISVAEAMIMAILPIVLLRVLQLPEFLYGVVFVAARLAVIAGAWAAPAIESRISIRSTCSFGLVGIAASTLLIATGASLAPPTGTAFTVSGLAVLGIAGSVWNIGLTTLFTRDADSSVLGRVSVNVHTLIAIATMTGAMLGGWTASRFGVHTELWVSAGIAMAGAFLMTVIVSREGR
jgi:predicted MFS family arabinose efflux permease